LCEALIYLSLEVVKVPDATGEFSITGWDEQTYSDRAAGKVTRARVTQDFSGDTEGTGRVEWLLCYWDDETADFVGSQEIDGRIGDQEGRFVVTSVGTFDGKKAAGRWAVVTGSGTGDFAGITGGGEFTAPHGGTPAFQLSYELG
jgi:hypothetical protein